MRRLILRSFQSPGDIVMLTAALRDLHWAHPGRFQTDVRTSANELWRFNPNLTHLEERGIGVETIDMHYPLIHHSNQRPAHFLHGYAQFLGQRLGLTIPVSEFCGDLYLSTEERDFDDLRAAFDLPDHYWIVVAGGKYDFTAKWVNPARLQSVIEHFHRRIQFVQCGAAEHWHPSLEGVINLVGQTDIRQFVRLIYHAAGVLCPVTLAMHLAAAVPTRLDRPRLRPCVVLAGGREPPHREAYPGHQFLHTVGQLECCANGGCWKSRCQLVGDGDEKDRRNLCVQPVPVSADLTIPRCLELITTDRIVECINLYEQHSSEVNC